MDPVDPVKIRRTGRSESEKDPFYGVKSDEDPDGAAWPGLDRAVWVRKSGAAMGNGPSGTPRRAR